MSDNTKKAFFEYSDFSDFEEVESVTLYNGLTLTEGSDRDASEFFNISLLDDMMM